MRQLPQPQAAALVYMFDHAPIERTAETLSFSLAESSGKFHAAISKADGRAGIGHPSMDVVFTLATFNDRIFLAPTRSEQRQVARVLANLEDYEREGGKLRAGDAIRIPDRFFSANDRVAALLLEPCVLNGFEQFPDCADVAGRHLAFSLVVFLTSDEFAFRAEFGHDALMSRFEDSERSTIAFG